MGVLLLLAPGQKEIRFHSPLWEDSIDWPGQRLDGIREASWFNIFC